jgi:hypothetical protein
MAAIEDRHLTLVGVFRTTDEARQAAEALAAAGISRSSIRVGDHRDEVASARGEMRDEPATKEMAKGIALAVMVGAVIGAIVGLPFALIPMGGLDWWARVLIVAAVGALAGSSVGLVAGGGLGSKGPGDPVAAQRGVTVGVTDDLERARRVLVARHPIRLDVVDRHHAPVDVVDTDDDRRTGVAHDLARNLDQDDYHRDSP